MRLCGVVLNEREKQVLHLCTLDCTYEEIAMRLGQEPGAVRSILFRLRKRAQCQTNEFLLYSYGLALGIEMRVNKDIE